MLRAARLMLVLTGCNSVAARDAENINAQDAEDIEVGELLPDNFGVGDFVPRDGEFLKLEARVDGRVREVPHRGVIEEGEVVVFVTRVDPSQNEYVYLLEGTGGPPRMIHPRMGRVHLSRETNGERRIRPRPAHEIQTGEEDEPEGWQVSGGSWAEYRLVATPSPRDEAAAGSLGSHELFLDPVPYVTGLAGSSGRLVDSIIVRWK
jgi:hypothetical protein